MIQFGIPIPVNPALIENFKIGKKRDAIGRLMGAISDSLASVTLSAPDFDTLMVGNTPFFESEYLGSMR